jgi:patatin-like phospholipase/acyl hydrolase
MDPTKPVFTILSFVGGGIRGLLSATILQRLYNADNGVIDRSRMLAGCSTGAIITSELLAGQTPQGLVDLFMGSELKFYDGMNNEPDKPAYSIDEVLLSQGKLHKDKTIAQAGRDVLLVSFNVGSVQMDGEQKMMPTPWKPMMFTNMLGTERDRLDGLEGHSDTLIAVAATSSGAMPGQLGSMEGNVDGAFFNHDPTVAAICLAVRNGHPLENIVAITIGTGLMPYWLQSDTHDWGARQWMQGDGNPFDNVTPFLMNQSVSSPVLDLSLNGTSAEVMPHMAKMLLGERYVNINPRLPCFIPENSTNAQALSLLRRHGEEVNIDDALALIGRYWNLDDQARSPSRVPSSLGARTAPAAAPAKAPSKAPSKPSATQATPGHGAQFFIKHKGSTKVLDVNNGSGSPGAAVILWEQKASSNPTVNNQLWEFVPSLEDSGWWYLRTMMGTGLVMTMAGDTTGIAPRISMAAPDDSIKDRQLWNLVSTEQLGWFFIQCKAQSQPVPTQNPDSYVPTVIGAGGGTPAVASGLQLNFELDGPMAWSFTRVDAF